MSLPFNPAELTLTEIIRLQNLLSQELSRRFEVSAALAFADIVGSTAYFARFGDEAGRQLQQLHIDLLQECLPAHGGRIVDTAGDGAFCCFPTPTQAADALVMLLNRVSDRNAHRAREQQLTLRVGIHWGRVLSDGVLVTGDAVNLAARIAATADPGQIRLSREAFQEFDAVRRLMCRPVGAVELKGAPKPLDLMSLEWRDRSRFPSEIFVRETHQVLQLPQHDIVSFGRLEMIEGMPANDIVLSLPDPAATRRISRWHFELRRRSDGYVLRPVSAQFTSVDGQPVEAGQEVPIRPGSVVGLSDVMTLVFSSPDFSDPTAHESTSVILRHRATPAADR